MQLHSSHSFVKKNLETSEGSLWSIINGRCTSTTCINNPSHNTAVTSLWNQVLTNTEINVLITRQGYYIRPTADRWRIISGLLWSLRTVPGSIPGGVTGFFTDILPSDRTMALGSTQPLVKMSTTNIPGGKGGRCVTLTTSQPSCAECHENLGA